jgi:pantothenate kinase
MLISPERRLTRIIRQIAFDQASCKTPLSRFGTITDHRLNNSLTFAPFPQFKARHTEILSVIVLDIFKKTASTGPFMIGISGPRNASKSFTARNLAERLSPFQLTEHLSMDDYIKPDAFFKAEGIDPSIQAKDPSGIDFDRLRRDLERICNGGDVALRTRDRFKADHLGNIRNISGNGLKILIVEGLSALLPDQPSLHTISTRFDLKIFLQISSGDAEKRIFQRVEQQRAIGLNTLNNEQIYHRFRTVDLPRFTSHYPVCRSEAEIIAEFIVRPDQNELSSLIFTEDALCRMLI